MFAARYLFLIPLGFALTCDIAAQDLTPVATTQGGTRLILVYLVHDKEIQAFPAEVASDLFLNIPIRDKPHLRAAAYRFTADNSKCESYVEFGSAVRISNTQVVVRVSDSITIHSLLNQLVQQEPTNRHALVLFPSTSKAPSQLKGSTVRHFSDTLQTEVNQGGLIAVPVATGRLAKAVTCKCKSLFGCTTGCCTNPTCNVILGICQSNENCKKVDLTSLCSCQ